MFPVCEFEHLGETFAPATPVDTDHPMVAARPDLFTAVPASAGKDKTPKKAST